MSRFLCLALLAATLTAEDSHPLDPSKPLEAVQIIQALTEKIVLPRDQGVALTIAINTLNKLANDSQVKPVPVPETKKDKP